MRQVWLAVVATVALAAPAAGAGAESPAKTPGAGGLRLASGDGRFSLQLSLGFQGRYSYVAFDDHVVGNEHDYSSFYLRRGRMWLEGSAYDPRLTYKFQVQFEPWNSVNLLEAWVEYKFSDWLTLGAGRFKIAYGLEFLNSGFALNFIDRSVMYGETDIDRGGGRSSFPGGGTASFPTSAESANTGFPVGGLQLYRSQGVQLAGRRRLGSPTLEYQLGLWQGRNTRGNNNQADRHLVALRVGYYPMGFIDWKVGGDPDTTEHLAVGVIASAYTAATLHDRTATGAAVPEYEAHDTGWNLAGTLRRSGFSADLEWGHERYDVDSGQPGDWTWDREAWRASLGYFVRPGKLEIVARAAEIQRLVDATPETSLASGLGLAKIRADGEVVSAVERRIDELTAGVNLLLDGNRHKLAADVSRLTRSFAPVAGQRVDDQVDWRFRTMYQLKI